jgi:hypothetical protein
MINVLHLGTGATGKAPPGTEQPIRALSIHHETPTVFLLTAGSDAGEWRIHRLELSLSTTRDSPGAARHATLDFAGAQARLHGHLLTVLVDKDADQPEVIVHDLMNDQQVHRETIQLPRAAEAPWRLLASDARWTVIESAKPEANGPSDADAPVWVHDARHNRIARLGEPSVSGGDEWEPARYGAFRIDGHRLYNEVWDWGWGPSAIQVRTLPGGRPTDLAAGGLLRGLAVDDGRLVIGNPLRDPPLNPVPWISHNAMQSYGSTQEAPMGFELLVLGLAASVALLRHRNGASRPDCRSG